MNTSTLAYFFGRLMIGMSMFGHGIIRLPKLQTFSNGMIEQFESAPLPEFLVLPFSYLLPVAELTVGILLLLGLFTRLALIAGCVIVLSLIFGSSMIENWNAVTSQLVHGTFFVVLLAFVSSYNGYSFDRLRKRPTNA